MTSSRPCASPAPPPLQWDIFCRVIDNFGDIGVCWRLAANLAARGQQVRLWTDDASALAWLAPQGRPGVAVRPWGGLLAAEDAPTQVLVEAFGCDIAPEFLAQSAEISATTGQKHLWINLEHLSAEGYVERCHRLPSPVRDSAAAGGVKWFFYPGFTPATGGLLREADLLQRQAHFDATAWRRSRHPEALQERWISLFCYEPAALPPLLQQCMQQPTRLLVTLGRATAATQAALQEISEKNGTEDILDKRKQLSISYLPHHPQAAFDEMLWACDLNLVRGEDSLVRALWAGRPLVWHIYPQHDNAHHGKLHAFLDWLQAPPSLRQFHATWNGLDDAPIMLPDETTLAQWAACVQAARARLLAQDDLVTQILGFVNEKR
ncbi:MAG TPA: elongation factor P maturation arginine rhamnosyltransferase EarP [Comamonadaceae bacterium]|nr:elongation factor P maturation arginine rhamnosyltransferase EarP [Comamonadaceae bacterium]